MYINEKNVKIWLKKEKGDKTLDRVLLSELVNTLQLEIITGENNLHRFIETSDISRPGLELAGYFEYYPSDRVQMLGKTEISFIEQMDEKNKEQILRRLCIKEVPAMIVSRQLDVPKELIKAAQLADLPVLRSPKSTSSLGSDITNFLEGKLAKRTSIHGVLMDVYGLGVLIQGDSGIGKSETGLELIKKGHRLIADDRVDVYQHDSHVIGEAPSILQNVMEIRGIGIIDVMNLFGAGAVRKSTRINLVIYLEQWSKDKKFDRLGHANETLRIADVDLPKISIPVKTGRNVSAIIEVAAMNYRAKSMGYDATKMFNQRLTELIADNKEGI